MPRTSEYAEYAERLRARRLRLQQALPAALRCTGVTAPSEDEARLDATSRLLRESIRDLAGAEAELLTQNEDLMSARLGLEGSAARFRQLFELAPTAYLVTTRDARILDVNQAACTLLQRPPNALAGKPLACFVELADRPAFRTALARTVRASTVEEWPLRLTPTGSASVDCRARVRSLPPTSETAAALAWCIIEDARSTLGDW